MRLLKEFFLIYISIVLQSQLRVLSAFDLLCITTFYLVLRQGLAQGAFFGFIGGLFWDSLSGSSLMMKSAPLMASCCIVAFFHSFIYHEHMSTRFGMVLLGTFLCHFMECFIYFFKSSFRHFIFPELFQRSLLTALLAVFVYPMFDRIFKEAYDRRLVA